MASEKTSVPDSESDGRSEKIGIHGHAPRVILDNAELVTSRGNIVTKDGVVVSTDDSDHSLSTNVFQDPEVKAYYVDIYEKAQYECRHVFDADLTWTKEEEKKIVRKLDWRGLLHQLRKHLKTMLIFVSSSMHLGVCHVLQSAN